MKNMAPIIATDLLKTFKLPGDGKQHLLNTALSSLCSMTWKSVCAEHWHSAMFKLDFFSFFLTIVSSAKFFMDVDNQLTNRMRFLALHHPSHPN